MIDNIDILMYICQVTGKPVLIIYNDKEQDSTVLTQKDKRYFYLIDSFTPANAGNHIYDCKVQGRDLSGVLNSIQGYSHGHSSASDQALMTKVDELPVQKFEFNGFRWIKVIN